MRNERNPARGLACWLVFMVLTGLSLWCAYGTTAIQLASRIATQAVASTTDEDNRAKLKRLRAQRDALSFTETSAEAVKAAEDAVDGAKKAADEERTRGGCKDFCRQREGEERDARAALRKFQENRAATVKAAELDRKIEDAEAAVRGTNTVDTKKEADPQSASMAKAIGADQDLIAAISHAFFAISIDLGSGVGFWLVFGHGRREENAVLPAPGIDRAGAEDLVVIEQTPADIVGRFFLEAVRPARGRRAQSLTIWSTYKRWCAERPERGAPVTQFGKLARWPKERTGGVVWYLDCDTDRLRHMVEAFAKLPAKSAILDGELVLIDPRGAAHFWRLMAEMRQRWPNECLLMFLAFDILHQDGVELRGLPLAERKKDLNRLCRNAPFLPPGSWHVYRIPT